MYFVRAPPTLVCVTQLRMYSFPRAKPVDEYLEAKQALFIKSRRAAIHDWLYMHIYYVCQVNIVKNVRYFLLHCKGAQVSLYKTIKGKGSAHAPMLLNHEIGTINLASIYRHHPKFDSLLASTRLMPKVAGYCHK